MKTSLKFLIVFVVFAALGVVISVQNFGFDIKSKLAFLSQAVNMTSARNYYVDSVNGDDTALGTSPETAWKTLIRLKAGRLFDNGTTINLKRSSVWNETLAFSSFHIASNAGENPRITIQSYGDENDPVPVINGSKMIEGDWKKLDYLVGDGKLNIWTTTVNDFDIKTDLFSNLFSPGMNYSQSRHPDMGSIPVFVTGARTGPNLASETFGVNPNADSIFKSTGGPYSSSLYLRRNDWHTMKTPIESFDTTNNIITVGAPTNDPFWSKTDNWAAGDYSAKKGYGYFYKNHIGGISLSGEWVFSKSSKILYVGLPVSSIDPSNISFGARTGVEIKSFSKPFSVTIKDISIENTGGNGIYMEGLANINIDQVKLRNIGLRGISINKAKRVWVTNSKIENTFSYGIGVFNSADSFAESVVIKNNELVSNGQLETQPFVGAQGLSAISVDGVQDMHITNNNISESGVSAMSLSSLGKTILIQENSIKGFARLLNDEGAIYINGQNSQSASIWIVRNTIEGNLPEINSLPSGSEAAAPCIYLDWATSNVRVQSNNLKNCYSEVGAIFVQSGSNNRIERNTIMQSIKYPTIGFAHWNKNMIDPPPGVKNGVTNNMEGNVVSNNTFCTLLTEPFAQRNLTSEQVKALFSRYAPTAQKFMIHINAQTMFPGSSSYYDTHKLPFIETNTMSNDCK